MAEELIKRKDLLQQLPNKTKKLKTWFFLAERLGLIVTQPPGGTSHYCLRFKGYENSNPKGLVCTVYDGMSNVVRVKVFKEILKKGFQEDDVWRALDMLD